MTGKPLFLIISKQKLTWKTKYAAKEGISLKDVLNISDCWFVLASGAGERAGVTIAADLCHICRKQYSRDVPLCFVHRDEQLFH